MFDGANLILISDLDQDKWVLGSHEDYLSMHHLLVKTNQDIKMRWNKNKEIMYPGIQFRLPCNPPPRTIFHGCQIVHWDPLDGKRRCPQKKLVWAM